MTAIPVHALRTLLAALTVLCVLVPGPLRAAAPEEVLHNWYRLALELVRHTPTYSPPVASRAFAYLGVTGYEAIASGRPNEMASLSGQINGLGALPVREADVAYDEAAVLHGALAVVVPEFFGNTGPTGQRAMAAMTDRLGERVVADLDPETAARSLAFGEALAEAILRWSMDDGGAVVKNLGFPIVYPAGQGPASWVPTSLIALQQTPLLPAWGTNRTFAIPTGASCPVPPPPAYAEDPESAFHAEAREVYETSRALTEEHKLIARFWSDDPMLSPTPPGHWISILLQLAERDGLEAGRTADALARLGIAMADSFIGCWRSKYDYDLLRPVTYIRRVIDPAWEPLLITPPFPEYPSGHSTQSGAAAVVLTALFGEDFAFEDATHEDEGLPVRSYPSFEAAAEEAALSRLYGGIHFRAAIERGLDQGRCIGTHAVRLTTFR